MNQESTGKRAAPAEKSSGGSSAQLNPLERLGPMARREQARTKLLNFLKVKLGAYSIAAAVGAVGGNYVQNLSREVTGYDPVKHEQFLKKRGAEQKAPKAEGEKESQDFSTWFNNTLESLKESALNPRNFIENTETYKVILEKYYAVLKMIDNVAFIAPALLIFIMLGGYINRKLVSWSGDVVAKAQNEKIRLKINEMINRSNELLRAINERGANALSAEELDEVRRMLKESKECLPPPEELE